jgi:hypothetical protein
MRASSRRAKSRRAASGPAAPPARRTVNASPSPAKPTFIGPRTLAASERSFGCSVRSRNVTVSQSLGRRRSSAAH